MHLTKHHGMGNDFLVTFLDEVPTRAPELAVELCDRSIGIGADGLIFGIDDGPMPVMRLFNSDGSSAEISGNGLRCFVQALAMRRNVQELEIDVDTLAGVRACTLRSTTDTRVSTGSTDMGPVTAGDEPSGPAFLTDANVHANRWAIGAVGNPHLVIDVDDPTAIDLAVVGPVIEQAFPHGVNAHFIRVVAPDRIELAIWERGAGITSACGSGATVAAQRAFDWGKVGPIVQVDMPGGSATVNVCTDSESTAVLTGTATYVGAVQVPRG